MEIALTASFGARKPQSFSAIHVRTLTRMSLPSIKISQRAVGYRESVIEAYIASREAVR